MSVIKLSNNPSSSSSEFKTQFKLKRNGINWALESCGPFYLISGNDEKDNERVSETKPLTGSTNLIKHYGLESAYNKLCGKKLSEELSAFLPHISGDVDVPADQDDSGLQSLVDKPPICGKEILPISDGRANLAFRLHPGPLPPKFSTLFTKPAPAHSYSNIKVEPNAASSAPTDKKRERKRRRDVSQANSTSFDSASELGFPTISGNYAVNSMTAGVSTNLQIKEEEGIKIKKQRRPEDEERKKKKKEKKEKKKKKEKD